MGLWQRVCGYFAAGGEYAAFENMTEHQGEAFLEALVLTALVCGRLADEEYRSLLGQAMEVPVLRRQGLERVRAVADRLRAHMASCDERDMLNMIEPLAARLASQGIPEAMLEQITKVCLVDLLGPDDPYEHRVLRRFAQAWGISAGRVREIYGRFVDVS